MGEHVTRHLTSKVVVTAMASVPVRMVWGGRRSAWVGGGAGHRGVCVPVCCAFRPLLERGWSMVNITGWGFCL